jgi:hypothetical protein
MQLLSFNVENLPLLDIHRRMQAVYGDKCVDVSTARRWVWEFKREEEGIASLCDKVRSGRPVSYKIYDKISVILCAPSTLFSGVSSRRLFLFPKLKTTLKGHRFKSRGDSGKYDKRNARHHRKCVPGSIPTLKERLGTVYRQ